VKVKTYDEVNPLEVLQLNMSVLEYPLTPEVVQAFHDHDRRATRDLFYYAVVEGKLVGQAGLLTTQIETTEGPMKVGNAMAVCTDPGYARRGIARHLMAFLEEKARELQCRAITLATSRSRVSHHLYRDVGYIDLVLVWSAYNWRAAAGGPAPRALEVRQATEADLPLLEQTFYRNTAGMLGFVHRHEGFLQRNIHTREIDISEIHGVYQGGAAVGYLGAKRTGNDSFLLVRQAVLPGSTELADVIKALQAFHKTPYVIVADEVRLSTVEQLRNHGYEPQVTWGTVMLRSLDDRLNFRELLGVTQGRFFMDCLDFT